MNAVTQGKSIEEYFAPDLFLDHHGKATKSFGKGQRKLVPKIERLVRFLEADEKIRLITVATSPMTLMEQATTGSIIYYVKRCLLVFTNKRMLHVPSDYYLRYRHSVAEVRYHDCKRMAISWGQVKVEYGDGSVEKFANVAAGQRKKLQQLLSEQPWDQQATPAAAKTRTHLCPRCAKPLEKDRFACSACMLEFKDKDSARKISWLVPGGGYFYTGHPIMGTADAFTEGFLMLMIILNAMGPADERDAVFVGVIGFILLVEKALTVYHSNHYLGEFIPKTKLD